MGITLGAAALMSGLASTQASAVTPDVEQRTYRVSGSSTTGCSYASGTVTVTYVSVTDDSTGTPWGFGVAATSWNMQVEDRCAEDGQAHLRARYGAAPITNRWVTVASSGTLGFGAGLPLPATVDFAVCDYSLLKGHHACGDVEA
jgi:hypothetical protein